METNAAASIPTRTRSEDAKPAAAWRCGHCGGHHWRGNICTCAGFAATRPRVPEVSVDDIELEIW